MLMDQPPEEGARNATDPSPFSRWVLAHPLVWGAASGALFASIGFIIFHQVALALAGGVVVGGVNAFLWRSKGPAARWRQTLLRRFPRE